MPPDNNSNQNQANPASGSNENQQFWNSSPAKGPDPIAQPLPEQPATPSQPASNSIPEQTAPGNPQANPATTPTSTTPANPTPDINQTPLASADQSLTTPSKKRFLIPLIVGAIVLLIIIGLVVFFFLSNRKQETGNIKMWGFEDPITWRPIFQKFEAENNVKIEYSQAKIDNYESALLSTFASATTPDIFPLRSDWYFKDSNKVSSTTEYSWLNEMYPYAKNTLIQKNSEGKDALYGIPLSADSLALYYNKTLLGSVNPEDFKTWDQIKTWASTNTQKSGADISTSAIPLGTGANINYSADILSALMLQNGTEMTDDTNKLITYERAKALRSETGEYFPGEVSLDYYTSFAKSDSANYSWNSTLPTSSDAFGQNKAKLYLGFAQDINYFKNNHPLLDYGILPLPQISNSDESLTLGRFWNLSVAKYSPRPKLAWKLLEFIAKSENTNQITTANNTPSPYKSAVNELENMAVFNAQAEYMTNWNKFSQNQLDTELVVATDSVIGLGQTPKQAISLASQRSNSFIKEKEQLANLVGNKSEKERLNTIYVWTLLEDDAIKTIIEIGLDTAGLDKNKEIIAKQIDEEDFESYYIEEVASNRTPDMVFIDQNLLRTWLPRIQALSEDEQFIKYVEERLVPDVAENNIIDNKLMGVPYYKNVLGLIYNKNILQKSGLYLHPETWDDLRNQLKIENEYNITNFVQPSIALGTANNITNAPDVLMAIMLQYGATQANRDLSQVTFNLPNASNNEMSAQKALEFYRSFSDKSATNNSWDNSRANDFDAFVKGEVAYVFAYWKDLSTILANRFDFDIDYGPLPQISYKDAPVDIMKNDIAVIPINSPNGQTMSKISPEMFYNFTSYSSFNNWPSPFKVDYQNERRYVKEPYGVIGNNAHSIYKNGTPFYYNQNLRSVINGEISLDKAAENINTLWRERFGKK